MKLETSMRASELCRTHPLHARWLNGVEADLRRACAVVARAARTLPAIEIRSTPDERDGTPSVAAWAAVRHVVDALSAEYDVRVTADRLPNAVLFRVTPLTTPTGSARRGNGAWWRVWARQTSTGCGEARGQRKRGRTR